MAQAQTGTSLLWDMLCCLGLGVLTGALHEGAGLLTGEGRGLLFLRDVLAFALAAVLLFSYGASRSLAGGVRGYMLLALAAGWVSFASSAAPLLRSLARRLRWLAGRPAALLVWLLWPLGRWAAGRRRCFARRYLAKRKQKRAKRLQKNSKVLYNSN